MAFTTTSVEELGFLHGEPDWLRARRRDAFATYERLPLPSRSDEEWRRTDIRGLNLEAFEPFERADGAAPADPIDEVAGVLRQRGSEPGLVELDPSLAGGRDRRLRSCGLRRGGGGFSLDSRPKGGVPPTANEHGE